jgi:hypothetical protein
MKKIILLIFASFLLINSCAIFKSTKIDPLLGKFNITLFDTPMGDISLILEVNKTDGVYSALINGEGQLDGVFEVDAITVLENNLSIDAAAGGMEFTLEMQINEDEITGSVMDLDIKGERIVE